MAAGPFSYDVTASGAERFEVSATHPLHGIHLIGAFDSLEAAETFAETMRAVDAGVSHRAADYRVEILIRRNHELLAASAKARSEIEATALNANHARAQARAMRAYCQGLRRPS